MESLSAGAEPFPGLAQLHNLRLEAELKDVLLQLETVRITPIILKGFPLARELHARLPERHVIDNDLYVAPGQVQRAADTLRGLGYRTPPGYDTHPGSTRIWQCPFIKLEHGCRLEIDLHWRLLSPRLFSEPAGCAATWSRSFLFGGRQVKVLTPEHCVLQLAAHYVQHQCQEVRILDDLAAAWNRLQPDAGKLAAIAQATRMEAALSVALSAANRRCPLSGQLPALETYREQLYLGLSARLANAARIPFLPLLLAQLLGDPKRLPRTLLNDLVPERAIIERAVGSSALRAVLPYYVTRYFNPLRREGVE